MASSKPSPFDGVPVTQADGPSAAPTSPPTPTVMIRKLPRNTTKDTLNSMLLFAKDLIAVDFVESQDAGYLSALAKFRSDAGAREARNMLNGKPNSTKDANMIVEVVSPAMKEEGLWRLQQSAKSPDIKGMATTTQGPWQPSRFNETFQALDREQRVTSPSAHPNGDGVNGHQSYFGHASPISQTLGRQSNTGKSMISNDEDDETGKLLDDPMGFMVHDLASSGLGTSVGGPSGRRSTLPHVHVPVNGFANMSLNGNGSNMASPRVNGMISPRMGPLHSPNGFAPSNIASLGPNASYQYNQNYMRHNFPPINPSDQNPPCNTLYVGNLPMDASEDELKSVFSKQRGYKRLCLRTKSNGPMCFVEFEDITCASKALTECYGVLLHNSTKGGIRLSFSKNPLGVRNGQPGSMSGPSAMSPQGPMPGMGGMPNFSSINGPPPGLGPPGMIGGGMNGNNGMGMNGNNGMGISSPNGTPSTNGFPNPMMSPIGSTSSQSMRTPTSAIGQGWNWPTRDTNKRDVPASMMGR